MATQFTTAVSPGLDGTSPKLNGIINGGTRTINYSNDEGTNTEIKCKIEKNLKQNIHQNLIPFAPFTTNSVV